MLRRVAARCLEGATGAGAHVQIQNRMLRCWECIYSWETINLNAMMTYTEDRHLA